MAGDEPRYIQRERVDGSIDYECTRCGKVLFNMKRTTPDGGIFGGTIRCRDCDGDEKPSGASITFG